MTTRSPPSNATVWLRDKVLIGRDPSLLLASAVFRVLGDQDMFTQMDIEGKTDFESFLSFGDVKWLTRNNRKVRNLSAKLKKLNKFYHSDCPRQTCGKYDWECVAQWMLDHPELVSLPALKKWLATYLGRRVANLVAQDLMWVAKNG